MIDYNKNGIKTKASKWERMNQIGEKAIQIMQIFSADMDVHYFTEQDDSFLVRFLHDGKISFANSAFLKALGCTLADLLGQEISKIVQISDPKVVADMHDLFVKNRTLVLNLEVKITDRSLHWYHCQVEQIQSEAGTGSEIQIIGTDITTSKRMEQVIELQRQLFNSSSLSEAELSHLFFEAVAGMNPFSCGLLLFNDRQEGDFILIKKEGTELSKEIRHLSLPEDASKNQDLFPAKVKSVPFGNLGFLQDICCFEGLIQSAVVIPLKVKEECIGSILLGNPASERIDAEFEKQLQILANQLGAMIVHAREKAQIMMHEEELQSLFNSISEMLLLINNDGKIIEVNPALSKALLSKQNKTTQKSIFALHPRENQVALSEAIKKVNENINTTLRIPLITGQGERIETELEMAKGLWRDQPVIICLYRDIRHRIQVERLEDERRRLANALADSAAVLNSSLNLEDVLAHILETVGNVVSNTNTNIMALDGNIARVIASRGYENIGTQEILNSRIIDITKVKKMAEMVEKKHPVVISKTKIEPEWVVFPETIWIRSYIGAPIIVNGQVYGFINCDSDTDGFYNETHALNLKLFADQAAIAIENARLHDEANRHLRQLTQITDLTREVLVSHSVTEVFQKVSEPLIALFEANSMLVTKWDSQNRVVSHLASKGSGIVSNLPRETKANSVSLTEMILSQKHAMVLSSAESSEEIKNLIARVFTDPYILALPMMVEENPFGVIFLGLDKKNQITEEDKSIGEYAANQLATAIQKSMMLESEQKLTRQYSHANELISSLSRVAASVNSSAGPMGVMETMGNGLEKMHIHSMVFLMDDTQKEVRLEYTSRLNELKAFNEKLETNYFLEPVLIEKVSEYCQVIHDRQAVFLNSIMPLFLKIAPTELTPFIQRGFNIFGIGQETKSLLLPLISESRPMGILNLYGEELMEIDQKAGETFSGQISSALENAKLLAKVQQLAITDELTGVLNRRGLFDSATSQFKTARRMDHTLSILMLDLDDFKEVNDRYGHNIGDDVLVEVVRRVKTNIREIDVLGRYGGEEFVVLLVENDLKAALPVAERIRSLVAQTPVATNEGPVDITVSIGVEELNLSAQTFEQLLKRADRALYIAKNRGKNQVATLTG